MKLVMHYREARQSLLDALGPEKKEQMIQGMSDEPERWIDELNMISQMISGTPLAGATGCFQPPLDDERFRRLKGDYYFFDGSPKKLQGVWRRNEPAGLPDFNQWTLYRTCLTAKLYVPEGYPHIDMLVPEGFDKPDNRIENPKRPIFRFNAGDDTIYAKGAYSTPSFFYSHAKPWFRLTDLAGWHKISSNREFETTKSLSEAGINVHPIIGYYEAQVEDFLFTREVKGNDPEDCLDEKVEIIEQDARMLAMMTKAGYKKTGFSDTDDKKWDGKTLYLIDCEEVTELYTHLPLREVVLDRKKLREFRTYQRDVANRALKDALFGYRDTLCATHDDKKHYITAFFGEMGWKQPNERTVRSLTEFGKNYMTEDSFISMMND